MWIIQIHKLKTKDYNYTKRALEKIGYRPRKVAWIILIKALFFHVLENKSWRALWKMLNTNYLTLYHFYTEYKKHPNLKNIFHHFAERWIIVYIGNKKSFHLATLLNNPEQLIITQQEIDKIFEKI